MTTPPTTLADVAALAATCATEPRSLEWVRTPSGVSWTVHVATCADYRTLTSGLPEDRDRRWLTGTWPTTPGIGTYTYHLDGGGCIAHVCRGCENASMSADRCPYNLDHTCEPLVRTVGDLTARHLGKRIRIPGLHQPGADWDAPPIAVEGRLTSMRAVGDFIKGRAVRLELSGSPMHDIITLNHPCEVLT